MVISERLELFCSAGNQVNTLFLGIGGRSRDRERKLSCVFDESHLLLLHVYLLSANIVLALCRS